MIVEALEKTSDAVFVDLLTYHDLERLKSAKQQHSQPQRQSRHVNTMKRYLILTYLAEFDRVHYPLPLNHEPTIVKNQREHIVLTDSVRGKADALTNESNSQQHLHPMNAATEKLRREYAALQRVNVQLEQRVRAQGESIEVLVRCLPVATDVTVVAEARASTGTDQASGRRCEIRQAHHITA